MDGVGLFLLLVFFGMLALLNSGGRSRADLIGRRQSDARIEASLHRTVRTDATGMLRCRRCGADGPEQAGTCRRCGATL